LTAQLVAVAAADRGVYYIVRCHLPIVTKVGFERYRQLILNSINPSLPDTRGVPNPLILLNPILNFWQTKVGIPNPNFHSKFEIYDEKHFLLISQLWSDH
jgi:hypothetical protein